VASDRAARWALGPLTRLRSEVSALKLDAPSPTSLASTDTPVELESLRAALISLVERLAEELARARRFSADAAHELKTPLTTISAELDLLSEEDLDAPSHSAVERLRQRTSALTRLIERLLALASARQDVFVEAVALEDVARDV